MTKILRTFLVLALSCIILLCCASCDFGADNNNDENEHVHSFVLENAVPDALKTEATCTSKAVYRKSCSCGEIGSETFEYGELGEHRFIVESVDSKYLASPATCYDPEIYYYSCSCGAAGEYTFYHGEPKGHNFENYVCTSCGAETSSEGLIYMYNETHNNYTVIGYNENIPEDLYISQYNGVGIVSIYSEAFKNCTKIKNVYISGSVGHIGQGAFEGCTNLQNVHLGNVLSIQTGAFADCPNLEQFTIAEDNNILKLINNCIISEEVLRYENGYEETVNVLMAGCKNSIIPVDQDIVIIAEKAFCGSGLTSVVIPQSVREIGYRTFYGCKDLKEITLNSGIALIGDGAFGYCTGLEKLYFNVPDFIWSNGGNEFKDMGASSNGVSLTIGKDVKSIPAETFVDDNISSIVFEEGCAIESIGIRAFSNTAIKTIEIPDSVSFLGENLFLECDKLTSVVLPKGITEISNGMFCGCSELASIEIPDSVTKIGESAFFECSSLTNIVLPNTLTYIGNNAFGYCQALVEIIISDTVSYIGCGVFSGCTSLTIYCRYDAAPSSWDEYWNDSNRPVVWGYKD